MPKSLMASHFTRVYGRKSAVLAVPLLQTSQDTKFFGLRDDFGFDFFTGAVDLGECSAGPLPSCG